VGIEMENKIKRHSALLFGLVLLLPSSVIACQPTPPLAPAPTPTAVVSSASLTEATMASEVDSLSRPIEELSTFWDDTSDIYCSVKVSDAPDGTEIKAEWIYIEGEEESLSNYKIGEESSITSGTRYLHFRQTKKAAGWLLGDYEVKLYLNGEEKVAVPFTITAAPPEPEVKELLVLHMTGLVSGTGYWVEGAVKNVGNVPLHDVQFEVSSYDKDGTLITTLSAPVEPSTIEVWETAHCKVEMQQAKKLKTFSYRFLLPSGEPVPTRFE